MQQILTNDKSTLVQVKAQCRQFTLVPVGAWRHWLTSVKVMASKPMFNNLSEDYNLVKCGIIGD